MRKLYLIDCSSIFFRAYYAIRFLNNSKGMPTNALYGYLAILTKLINERLKDEDSIAACYDRSEPSFREEIAATYKAHREETPEDLQLQIPYIKKLNDALAIQGFEMLGFEADDVIGTLTKLGRERGYEVMIVSGDKDFGQLLGPRVKLLDLGKDVTYDEKTFREKWGVDPHQMIDYLSIVGDASDNIAGVKGIGPKGAEKLLAEFKTLDDIYTNINLIKNERTRKLLLESKEQAYLARRLVTICTDVSLDTDLERLHWKSPNKELLGPLLQELEFKAFLQKFVDGGSLTTSTSNGKASEATTATAASPTNIPSPGVVSSLAIPKKVETVTSTKELTKLLAGAQPVWFDVSLLGVAAANSKVICRFEGNALDFGSWLQQQIVTGATLAGFDVKAQLHEIRMEQTRNLNVVEDVALDAYLLDPGQDVDFDSLKSKYLEADKEPTLASSEQRLQEIMRLNAAFKPKLEELGLMKLLMRLELPLIRVLYDMETAGVKIDGKRLDEFSKTLGLQIQALEKKIKDLTQSDFNIGSPKQLGAILFEKLKLPVMRKTKTGYSTDSDVLEQLKPHHPVAEQILEWRELTKLKSTYVDALPKLINPETGRVHTRFNQMVASTGRLSSTNPNLQNIPIRSDLGHHIRKMFIPEKGRKILSADYSQIELRILAHVTSDPGLVRAFQQDLDIHAATASEVFNVPLERVSDEQRRLAKAINFGIAYGMSDFGLAERLDIPRKEASEIIGRYMARYTGVAHYMEATVQIAKQRGYVGTLFGRRRYLRDINHSNRNVRMGAERAAINMPIQGTAADIVKKAMLDVKKIMDVRKDAVMLMQVHDELVFEVDNSSVGEISELVCKTMESVVQLKVPLKVSVGSGGNWDEAH